MKRKRFLTEQIVAAVKRHDLGVSATSIVGPQVTHCGADVLALEEAVCRPRPQRLQG